MTEQPFVTRPGLGRGDTTADLPTLVAVLRHHAKHFADERAITFLVDGENKEDSVTYAELDRRARAIAVQILEHAQPGDRALLLFPPGMNYITAFFGSLYAGVIAVPAYPPDPSPARLKRTLPRLQAIVADSGSTVILTDSMINRMAKALFVHAPELENMAWVATDVPIAEAEDRWAEPGIDAESIAFLQYTSGSTGTPRGVMLTHHNLLAEIEVVHEKFGHTPESEAVHWLPPYHDMGLIGAILNPFHGAFPANLMSPMAFLRKPARWLNAISRAKGKVSAGGPNFAYELLIRKTTPEQRAALDLSHWRLAYTGAEPIRASTLRRFTEAFAVAGFKAENHYPCYGLAEATLLVTGADHAAVPVSESFDADQLKDRKVASPASAEAARELVSSGSVGKWHQLALVNPETLKRCADDEVGELWVQGPIVARGYWNMPERSEAEFRAEIVGEEATGKWLRTGDLAFIREGGEVYIAGRIKDMIIIRGANIYPQDIEEAVEESHRFVRKGCIAAFAVEKGDEESLAVVTEVDARDPEFNADEVIAAVRKTVMTQFQVSAEAVVLIAAKSIPKTSSGKIQRHAAKNGFIDGSLTVVGQG